MTDPLFTYYATQDIEAVWRHLEMIIDRDPMNDHYRRNIAAFFYGLEKWGGVPSAEIKRRYPIGVEDVRSGATLPICPAFFMVVWASIQRWKEAVTVEEAVGGMREQILENLDACGVAEIENLSSEEKGVGAQQAAEIMLAPHPGLILGMPEFEEPKCNDMCYVLWGATGDRRYIERVIKALDQPADPTTMAGMVSITGAWSLDSLGQQYPPIKAITEGVPGAAAKIQVLIEKYQP